MGLIELGGWMMWPLLAVSVAALAIVVERALVFMGCPFPDSRFPGLVLEAMRTGDVRPLAARLEAVPSLRDFAALLGSPLPNLKPPCASPGRRCWNGWKRGFPCCPCWRGWPRSWGCSGPSSG